MQKAFKQHECSAAMVGTGGGWLRIQVITTDCAEVYSQFGDIFLRLLKATNRQLYKILHKYWSHSFHPIVANDYKHTSAMDSSNRIATSRRHDLDNLRTFLTCLVIAHHTSLVYGGSGLWPLKSACFSSTTGPLLTFQAINQSIGMGLFFWISGRMSAQMLERWSRSEFLQKKILRLGLPTLVYTILINPMTFAFTIPILDFHSVVRGLLDYWKSIRGVRGPVWYTALLLVFDIVAALIQKPLIGPRLKLHDAQEHRQWDILVYRALGKWGWLGIAAASFFVRLWYPVGTVMEPLSIQPAYLPQYIFAYSLGYLSVQQNEDRFTGPFGRATDTTKPPEEGDPSTNHVRSNALPLRFTLTISILILPACIIPQIWANWSGQPIDSSDLTKGGWNLSALIYAVWNEFSFVLVGPALMAHFQHWYNRPAASWLWQARHSYAAYLIHPPVSVAIELLIDWFIFAGGKGLCASDMGWWMIARPLIFIGGVGLVNSVVSFALGRLLVTYVPGVRKIV